MGGYNGAKPHPPTAEEAKPTKSSRDKARGGKAGRAVGGEAPQFLLVKNFNSAMASGSGNVSSRPGGIIDWAMTWRF